jgi:pyruvate-formate lyase
MLEQQVRTLTYRQRIEEIRKTKVEHTLAKRQKVGFYDIDDHGWIPWPEPVEFKPKSNHPSGGCFGARCLGENFRAWLNAHPVYIHPMSAMAGAWVGWFPALSGWRPEDRPEHLYPIHKEYNIVLNGIGGMNHLGPDMKIGLDLGWGGLLKKIRHSRDLNHPEPGSEMDDFYYGEEQVVLGVQEWMRKHVTKAREMAAAVETRHGASLHEIADMNEWLIDNPPRTLREATQFLGWFQSIDRMVASGGGLGQIDELLRPFYEADRGRDARSRVSTTFDVYDGDKLDDYDEQVVWCIASLLFNDTHYSQIGGPTVDGEGDLTSRVSFLVLEAVHRLRIPVNLAVRVHDKLNPELMRVAVQYLFADGTGPSYSCSGGLDAAYARNGIPIQLARQRAKVGCNWTALPGIEYCLQDVTRITFVAPFIHAFNEVTRDLAGLQAPSSPNQIGLPEHAVGALSQAERDRALEQLWERFVHHLSICVDTIKQGQDIHLERQARNTPEIVLNLFCHGPIERGLDVSGGGVDIYNMSMDGLGLATTADSFAAVEQRIVQEQRLSWDELATHLASNYAGTKGEQVRLMLKNIPRFGTGGTRADWWAKRIADTFTHLVKDKPTPKGFNVVPGLFSHGDVGMQGKPLGATPNGRRGGETISHSADPDPGFMPGGISTPTAKSLAVAAVQPGWGNSAPLQIDFDSKLANEMGGVDAIASYIKVHDAKGGTLVNINVISRQDILGAHKDPDKYPDLVVRVTGYSAFWRMLSPEYRQQIVDRLLAED